MYWQKRFERENPDQKLENTILEIREKHADYGYRRIHAALKNDGWHINKKKVQRIVQKLSLQVTFCGTVPHFCATCCFNKSIKPESD